VNFADGAFAIGRKSVGSLCAHQELGTFEPNHVNGGTVPDVFATCRILP